MIRRLALAGLAVSAALGLAAPSAQAGLLVPSAGSCENQTFEKPFLPWLDPADYVLAPDGGLETGGEGWSLDDGAAVVDGNETHYVRAADDSKSLRIPAGAAATSPAMCVGIEHPTLRFFVRRDGGTLLSSLRVDAIYENHLGVLETVTLGSVDGDAQWRPSPILVVGVNLLPLLPGDHTPVAFRFVGQGSADWQIDDVYVDPYTRT